MSVYDSRLQQLRQAMQQAGIDIYVILSSDPHLSEYLPEHYQARAWLSGFTGSAGSLVITADFAGLWTDSRYWVQAQQDLAGTAFILMPWGDPQTPDMLEWVAQTAQAGQVIGIDSQVMPQSQFAQWQNMAQAHQLSIQGQWDLMTSIWADRPALPQAPIYVHEPPFALRDVKQNIQQVRQAMAEQQVQSHLLSSLDDVAWLLNLRGQDVQYNPVFLAHVLFTEEAVTLFVDMAKVSAKVAHHLYQHQVDVQPYTHLAQALAALPEHSRLLVDPNTVTAGVLQHAAQTQWVFAPNPSTGIKACKTPAELEHVRQVMAYDGAALCAFFAWFEDTVKQRPIAETEIHEQITAARAQQPHFVSPSFGTIAAFGANAAMPHYQATEQAHDMITGNGLLLIDSGGQYLGGTTDITRVVPVGTPTPEQKRDYTLVLKGMIALSQAVFAKGVTGQQLDVIARMPLWQAGVDFGHGTGHGVGYFMNVHEGPQSISWRRRADATPVPMQPGMITSNEPGLYRAQQWGIRIENLIACVEKEQNDFGHFYAFESLTLCPIDVRCIETTLLNSAEIDWLNAYHKQVYERLKPLVSGSALQWLEQNTQPLATTNCSN
ncbi:MAG: aminopeptidase P family protein [Alcaligenaceae bacterium]|nr:aminopeptidase P family protein [Alcaligenaceae bacterium]